MLKIHNLYRSNDELKNSFSSHRRLVPLLWVIYKKINHNFPKYKIDYNTGY